MEHPGKDNGNDPTGRLPNQSSTLSGQNGPQGVSNQRRSLPQTSNVDPTLRSSLAAYHAYIAKIQARQQINPSAAHQPSQQPPQQLLREEQSRWQEQSVRHGHQQRGQQQIEEPGQPTQLLLQPGEQLQETSDGLRAPFLPPPTFVRKQRRLQMVTDRQQEVISYLCHNSSLRNFKIRHSFNNFSYLRGSRSPRNFNNRQVFSLLTMKDSLLNIQVPVKCPSKCSSLRLKRPNSSPVSFVLLEHGFETEAILQRLSLATKRASRNGSRERIRTANTYPPSGRQAKEGVEQISASIEPHANEDDRNKRDGNENLQNRLGYLEPRNIQDETIETDRFPYGRTAPVVLLLNQPPFADLIRKILVEAGIQDETAQPAGLGLEDDPAWKKAYLQLDGVRSTNATASAFQAPDVLLLQSSPHNSSFIHAQGWKPPDTHLLSEYVEEFSDHIQGMYPILPVQRISNLITSFLGRYEVPQPQTELPANDPTQTQVESAVELLVFAVGSICKSKCKGKGTAVHPGKYEFYTRAKGILEAATDQTKSQRDDAAAHSNTSNNRHSLYTRTVDNFSSANNGDEEYTSGSTDAESDGAYDDFGEERGESERQHSTSQDTAFMVVSTSTPTLELARAHLLAAIFCGQLAWLREAADHVRDASAVVLLLIRRPGGAGSCSLDDQNFQALPLIEYMQSPHPLAEEEHQLVMLYWICVQLEL
ncbi:hypothetical protein SPI_04504 [Niveomyces insectorum RCEF 264]|uniref:Uncharacterized protein n=1 Tax=Niveomyces insectorum RCEF 264 TaxID=1081102 RepID=A0A167UJT0_9HYPO|nr:hypothetical protein SPI_04504 [Niveomyces insectorum RCEF 264]